MNVEPGGSQGRWSSGVPRIRARRLVGGVLLCIVSVAVAGFTVLLSGPHRSGAGIVGFGLFVLLLAPVLTVVSCCAAAGVRAVRRWRRRRIESALQPANPPLEQIAASLRRLLWKHDMVARTGDPALSVWQLRAVEVEISNIVVQAARALDVSHPEPPIQGGFGTGQLRRLLRALAAEGLVLPPEVGLMASDRQA